MVIYTKRRMEKPKDWTYYEAAKRITKEILGHHPTWLAQSNECKFPEFVEFAMSCQGESHRVRVKKDEAYKIHE